MNGRRRRRVLKAAAYREGQNVESTSKACRKYYKNMYSYIFIFRMITPMYLKCRFDAGNICFLDEWQQHGARMAQGGILAQRKSFSAEECCVNSIGML